MMALQTLRASQESQAAKASHESVSTHMSCWQHCPSGSQGTEPWRRFYMIGTVPAGTSANVLYPAEGCPKCRACGSCGLSLGVGGARSRVGGARSYNNENCSFKRGTCMPWC